MILQLCILFIFILISTLLVYTFLIQLRDAFFRVQKQVNGYNSQWDLEAIETVRPISQSVEVEINSSEVTITNDSIAIPIDNTLEEINSLSPPPVSGHQRNASSSSSVLSCGSSGSAVNSTRSNSPAPPSYNHCYQLTPLSIDSYQGIGCTSPDSCSCSLSRHQTAHHPSYLLDDRLLRTNLLISQSLCNESQLTNYHFCSSPIDSHHLHLDCTSSRYYLPENDLPPTYHEVCSSTRPTIDV